MKTITIRQRTSDEGFKESCRPSSTNMPYIIEIDGKPLEHVRKFELTLDNDVSNLFNIAQYSATYYGMSDEDYQDSLSENELKKLRVQKGI